MFLVCIFSTFFMSLIKHREHKLNIHLFPSPGHVINAVVLVLPLRHIVTLYLHILATLLIYMGHQISKWDALLLLLLLHYLDLLYQDLFSRLTKLGCSHRSPPSVYPVSFSLIILETECTVSCAEATVVYYSLTCKVCLVMWAQAVVAFSFKGRLVDSIKRPKLIYLDTSKLIKLRNRLMHLLIKHKDREIIPECIMYFTTSYFLSNVCVFTYLLLILFNFHSCLLIIFTFIYFTKYKKGVNFCSLSTWRIPEPWCLCVLTLVKCSVI